MSADPSKPREVDAKELHALLDRSLKGALGPEEVDTLRAALDTLGALTHELEKADVTLARLRHMVFGASEKTDEVLSRAGQARAINGLLAAKANKPNTGKKGNPGRKRKGHGRRAAEDYAGAEVVVCSHPTLAPGERCPVCKKGKVYPYRPRQLIRVKGVAPLNATCYRLERLRCNLCGDVFSADAPADVGSRKYDDSAAAMLILLRYGCGLPHYRIERLGKNLRMPMPLGTQWDVIAKAADAFEPAWRQLIETAADADLIHIDDTYARVLTLSEAIVEEIRAGKDPRTGIFTSGVIAKRDGRTMALFFTSRQHAGENLAKVLELRAADRGPPIQMADALSRNTSGDFETIVANCMAHARRHFVDVVNSFPDEVEHALKTLGEVFRHDRHTREQQLSDADRLAYHQKHSAPPLEALKAWMTAQVDERKVEPNSTLGGAFAYMHNHWDGLTCFLREPGAPIDNNIAEQTLKRAIVHRKNSMFYKTENGARIGDMFMSLIHTAEHCAADPFDYLMAILRNAEAVNEQPENWMPWNYAEPAPD